MLDVKLVYDPTKERYDAMVLYSFTTIIVYLFGIFLFKVSSCPRLAQRCVWSVGPGFCTMSIVNIYIIQKPLTITTELFHSGLSAQQRQFGGFKGFEPVTFWAVDQYTSKSKSSLPLKCNYKYI